MRARTAASERATCRDGTSFAVHVPSAGLDPELGVGMPTMSRTRLRTAVLAIGAVRIGAGLALGGSPTQFLRWERDIPSGSSMPLMMRTVGIRDLALGLGTASALRSGSTRELGRWIGAGLISDVLDVGAGLVSARTTGVRGLVSSLVASPAVALDVWAWAALREVTREAHLGGHE